MFKIKFSKRLFQLNQTVKWNLKTLFNINSKLEQKLPSAIPISILNKIQIKNPIKNIEIKNLPYTVKNILVPTFSYLKINQIQEKILPSTKINEQTIKLAIVYGQRGRFSMNMLRIKRRKMKKHKLRKFRKRYRSLIMNTARDREILREKNFRAELLAQIRQAEKFDAEKYVNDILDTITSVKNVDIKKKTFNNLLNLIRKHKYETNYVKPVFDDPVDDDFKK